MRGDVSQVLNDPRQMIDFYYDKQSTGRRFDIQNRLFIVHHSFCDDRREFFLRCAWKAKRIIYQDFCNNIENIQFYNTHGVVSGVIFITEREQNKVSYRIMGKK